MRHASLFLRALRAQFTSVRRKAENKHPQRPWAECLEDRTLPSITLGPATLPIDTINVPYSHTYTAGGAINAFYANQVVSYAPGTIPDASYDNPAAALGGLNPLSGSYGGVNYFLTPFDPAFSSADLVEVGAGGSLVLKLAQTASTNGDTIGVHTGFGLVDADYPDGINTDPATYFDAWLRQADVLVSADGVNWGDLGTVTFDSPSNYDAGATTDPEGGTTGVGPVANPGQPFTGSLSSFNGEDWQQTLATLNGSAGGTWLNLTGVTDENGKPITGVNYIEFSVPNNPPLDPNTGNPEIMMVDAVVATNSNASISATDSAGSANLTVSDIQHPIAGLIVPTHGINSLAIGGTPKATGTETFTVTATDSLGNITSGDYSITVNPAPRLSISGPASVYEGTTYTLNLTGNATSPDAIQDWTVNWGDGTPAQTVAGNPTSVTHVYAKGPHTYVISASATDDLGTYKASRALTVSVKHVPPVLTISGEAQVEQGSTYTLDLSAIETAGHAVTKWFINWGDGSPLQTVLGNPASVTHVYQAGPSSHIIRASVADDVGFYGAGNTVTVTVLHVAPTLQISGAASVNEKQAYTLHLSSGAPGAITIKHWTIAWGDGTIQTVLGNPASVKHVYAIGPNTYTITATATDPEGTYAAVNTVTVTVNHVPPTLRISGAASVRHGAIYPLRLSAIDTHPIIQWTINWGDGNPVQTVTGNPARVTHRYAVGHQVYVITATATDAEGTFSAGDSVTVAVI